MKTRLLLLSVSFIVSITVLRAEGDSELEGQMKILARGTRQLSQQVADPAQQQATLELIEKLKKAALDSKALSPRKTQEVPKAGQEVFLADYRTELDELADAFSQIGEAVKAGEYAKAKSLLATVNSVKKEGHSKFKAD